MIKLSIIPKKDWDLYAESAHLICFGELRPKELNRYDFTIVAENKDGVPLVYSTIRENDSVSAYMQYGGAFPSSKGTILSYRCFIEIVEWLKQKYRHINMLVENKNKPMLKFAMSAGFEIIGIRNFKNEIYLELLMEVI
jgi:hypothetical protein